MNRVVETLRGKGWIRDCSAEIPDLATAFDLQDEALAKISAERGGFAGYKIAFNTKDMMAKLGLPHPGMGRIFRDQVFESGVELDVGCYRHFMIEPEIAAVLAEDMTPGEVFSAATAEKAVACYYPAFELLDRRNFEGMMHPPTVIAHNVFNAGIVLGGAGLPPAELDWASLETKCTDNGVDVVQGIGIAPQNPAEALAFLANHFTGRGQILPKGSLVLLGAHCPLYKVGAGRRLRLELGALGAVTFTT
ncbi:MAG: fumarylacetoacetate hydrolase family protein [Rhodobacteraceae bacterium]|nr:fumarylacetoacetate hydrolase family protein [Paracoccaceae bacterium]